MYIISYVLDETGSMNTVKDATVSGFNEYVQTLKKNITKKVKFFLTKFNSSKVEIVYSGVPLENVSELVNYNPDNMTPLYDAIGKTISEIDKIVRTKDKVLVVIQTDGQENSSREYSFSSIKTLIDSKKKSGWEFVFLGADIDAYSTGNAIGIAKTVSYSGVSTRSMYRNLAMETVCAAAGGTFDADKDFNKE